MELAVFLFVFLDSLFYPSSWPSYIDTLEGRYGFFPALRWTNIPFTRKYSSDICNLIVRRLLNYRPTAVGR